MKLKHSEFDIPPKEPYKNDLLNRQEFGGNLTKIVSQITSPLTISVNGSWGTGKTVFLKMWNQSLKNAGVSTIYFSAWEDDYCDNALLALIGQIWKNVKDNDWKEMGKTIKEIAIPLLKNVSSQFLTNAIRVCTANTVELDIEALKSHLESNIEKMLDEYVTATACSWDLTAHVLQRCRLVPPFWGGREAAQASPFTSVGTIFPLEKQQLLR